ncbi:transcriptional regulator [Ventosimonas gracilis]|uniref:Transcriptional regulator n=1 Tax=Ventosimonas gracilis TaxID=1680762 RepID=A0A139SXJ4_9GAMM|nr:type II toxin-antitoxin system HicB family antitoxin [Ventosimonas gracilis]KXU39121.1 transcriptional regulator [Ventosimonas gracilis]
MYHYALRFEQTEAGIAVFCRDLPELTSYGKDIEHALQEAVDAIETTLSIYVDQRRVIPQASAARAGEQAIYLPVATVAKIELWNAMQEQGMRKADLCRLLGISPPQGDRLVDFLHPSKISTLEQALGKLGRRLMVYAEAA